MNCSSCGVSIKNNNRKRKTNKYNFCNKNCQSNFFRKTNRLDVICNGCGKCFSRIKSECNSIKLHYCSNECRPRISGLQLHICKTCGGEVKRYASLIPKNGNVFCNNSCAGIWKNKNRDSKGTTRSKLENWIEGQLKIIYPDLVISYNKTSDINMELDIYIPSFNLAFEINGVFHYKDVFNNGLLVKRQELDMKKRNLCLNNGIKLIEINTSEQIYFTEKSSKQYLDIILENINKYL